MLKMHVLMVGGLPPSDPLAGGGQLVAYKLSEALASAGHAVHYLQMSSDTRQEGKSTPGFTHIAQRAGESWPSVLMQSLTGDHLAGYDVIHVHTGSGTLAFYLGCAVRRRIRGDVRLALTIHSPKVHAFPRSLDEAFWMLTCRAADMILAVSEFSRRDISRCYKIRPDKIQVVYNGVDTELFVPLRTGDRSSRDVSTLLFCGRLNGTKQKGLEVLLDAMPLILQRHDVVLNVIGVGPRLEEYKNQAKRLNLNCRVSFLGFVEHNLLPKHYANADLLVLPSRRESFGLVLAEAMACGLPVVSTKVGAIPEVVEDGVTGLLVTPDDPEALASAINSLLSDPGGMKQMGAKGRERVERHLTWDKVAQGAAQAYQRVMETPWSGGGNHR
jgi:glycosyltransferase involved in cell wall biosynthesis